MNETKTKIFKLLDSSVLLNDKNKFLLWSIVNDSRDEVFLISIMEKLQTEKRCIIESLKETVKNIDDNITIYELKDMLSNDFILSIKTNESNERIETNNELNNLLTQLV
ncbi:MAG: hypothetical protein ACD_3C00212G0004 [uncultured bacterium (gcode 4)]|uniref:Uncharacterized protein n=1 Tax=uncultured bacterium (gcode 4) TaxID=1234023 RepID=K2GVN6_9BACT|nr:MAG: hypothetical protein ACD_3C00212G0004 [uncultured bacterium (gcode 4)]